VARDRQRAKQRKARRGANPGPALSKPHRTEVPGELDHASGEVDEFEASLLTGSGGIESEASDAAPVAGVDGVAAEHPEELGEEGFDELDDAVEEADESGHAPPGGAVPARRGPAPGAPTRRGPAKFMGFLRASWAELQRVQWPDRRQVAQATGVVLGFVIIAGVYLGVADQLAQKLVNAIL
jgi:preprotein translocase subunit SecE